MPICGSPAHGNKNRESRDRESRDRESRDRESRDRESRDRESRDRESRDRESRDRESRDRESRDRESRDRESRDRESRDRESRDRESRDREAGPRRPLEYDRCCRVSTVMTSAINELRTHARWTTSRSVGARWNAALLPPSRPSQISGTLVATRARVTQPVGNPYMDPRGQGSWMRACSTPSASTSAYPTRRIRESVVEVWDCTSQTPATRDSVNQALAIPADLSRHMATRSRASVRRSGPTQVRASRTAAIHISSVPATAVLSITTQPSPILDGFCRRESNPAGVSPVMGFKVESLPMVTRASVRLAMVILGSMQSADVIPDSADLRRGMQSCAIQARTIHARATPISTDPCRRAGKTRQHRMVRRPCQARRPRHRLSDPPRTRTKSSPPTRR